MTSLKQVHSNVTIILILSALLLTGCSSSNTSSDDCNSNIATITPGANAQTQIQEAMLDINSGNQICLGEGTYELSSTLSMNNKTGVTIKGAGTDLTILSFAGQTGGSDGILISNSDAIVVQDLTIRDTQGDGLKFTDSDGIVMKNLTVEWSGEPSSDNGAYGLYPVLSSNILIEDSYVYGAADAGIYVGQSDKAIVRNSMAEANVAGIQIENTTNADVYGNTTRDNAAGIMVFDLPNLTRNGAFVRVFDNTVENNGRDNFAPSGIVSELPAGTGILTMSTDNVEIFNNTIHNNNLLGTAVLSFNSMIALGSAQVPIDDSFNPLNVNIHSNSYTRENRYVVGDGQSDLGNMLLMVFSDNPIPDIVIDGFFSSDSDLHGSVCFSDNSNQSFVNLNIPSDFPNNLSFDSSMHNCTMEPLPEVEINVPATE
jgi:parallel beta-helix repeat protein